MELGFFVIEINWVSFTQCDFMDEKDKEIPITETLDGFDQLALVEVDHKYVDSIDVEGTRQG